MKDLNLLYVFEALWRDHSVTIAAENIGLSQAAVSSALKRLRNEYGDKMFTQVGRRMEPTPLATSISRELLDALAMIQKTTIEKAQFDFANATQTFTVRTRDIGEVVCFPKILRVLAEEAPNVRLRSIFLPIDETLARLASGRIDIALGFLPALESDIHRLPLFVQNYVMVMRKDHPAADKEMTLDVFREGNHLLVEYSGSGHHLVEKALNDSGIKKNIMVRVPQYLSAPHLVCNTDLFWTAPECLAETMAQQFPLVIRELPIPLPGFEIAIYWHDRFHRDPANKWFRDTVAKLFRQERPGSIQSLVSMSNDLDPLAPLSGK